jgi:hypothetical protein
MSWRCDYSPVIGDVVCIIPSDHGSCEPYDHLELKPGIIVDLERVGLLPEIKASVLIEGTVVGVWYPDLFHIRQ